MALNTSRPAASLSRQALRHCRARPVVSSCAFATSAPRQVEAGAAVDAPRWARTPERMKAPFSPHIIRDPSRSVWHVNEDPQKLDDALARFLGRGGGRMLPDELKWLAVTHKSFDQGRRGFNDRLAFLGRQICVLEATQSILTSTANFVEPEADPYADRREPIKSPALRNVDNLTQLQPSDLFTLEKVAKLALDTGLTEVVRWKPRMPENIKGSGFEPVMAGAVYAIVGAVSLQHGGKVASRVVRERVLSKLGGD
ncbi:RNase III domain-containing protein [Biscogniauxia mediterranea]|nr:RNase III domain-containing protein [Biscogniauxia mediterranea]